jgi:hypothetical protein
MDLWDEERHIATCRGVTPIAERTAQEIRDALNQHDALLAERDELQAQRDALVKALARARQTFNNLLAGGFVEPEDSATTEIWMNELENMRAALALVRGEGEVANG